ncbi:hypothetical protein QTV49_004546 [Vibrio vulnificus]|nr:hypothetical protein [Vibrio vulnificus]
MSKSTKFNAWVKHNADKWSTRYAEITKDSDYDFDDVVNSFMALAMLATDELPKSMQDDIASIMASHSHSTNEMFSDSVIGVALILVGSTQIEGVEINHLEASVLNELVQNTELLLSEIYEHLNFFDEKFYYHFIASITYSDGTSDVCAINSGRHIGRMELDFIIRKEIDKGACLDATGQESAEFIKKMKSYNIITKEINVTD